MIQQSILDFYINFINSPTYLWDFTLFQRTEVGAGRGVYQRLIESSTVTVSVNRIDTIIGTREILFQNLEVLFTLKHYAL